MKFRELVGLHPVSYTHLFTQFVVLVIITRVINFNFNNELEIILYSKINTEKMSGKWIGIMVPGRGFRFEISTTTNCRISYSAFY